MDSLTMLQPDGIVLLNFYWDKIIIHLLWIFGAWAVCMDKFS